MAESVRVHDLEALGAVRAKSATPEFYFQDTDQVDPAGQMRFRMDGDVLRLQRSTAAAWASAADVITFNRSTGKVGIPGGFDGDVTVPAGAKIRLDGNVGGDTYLWEFTDDRVDWVIGGTTRLVMQTTFIRPGVNDAISLGTSGSRWSTIYGVDTDLSGALTVAGGATFNSNVVVAGGNSLVVNAGGSAVDQGMFSPAANQLAFSTGGIERMRLNSSGNLGIGTTDIEAWSGYYRAIQLGYGGALYAFATSASKVVALASNAYQSSLNVSSYKDSGAASRYTLDGGAHRFDVAPSGTADTAISWVTAMQIDSAGNIGIGTTDIEAWHGSYRVIQFHGGNAIGAFATGGFLRLFQNTYIPAGGGNYYVNSSDGAAQVSLKSGSFSVEVAPSGTADTAVSWTTALTIQSNGDVRSRALYPTTDNAFILGSANYRWTAVYATNGAIQTSARHLKNLHRPILPVEAMDALRALPIYEFTYKNDDGILRRFGPVLDEVPQWLRPNDDGETWVVGNLVAMNTLAIQATDDEVTRLRQRVEYLEARLN